MPGPVIEELPDDYDVSGGASSSAVGKATSFPCSECEQSFGTQHALSQHAKSSHKSQAAADAGTARATLRRGFFNKPAAPRPGEAAAPAAAPEAPPGSAPEAPTASPVPATAAPPAVPPAAAAQSCAAASAAVPAPGLGPQEFAEGLRQRLQSALDRAAAARQSAEAADLGRDAEEEEADGGEGLDEILAPLRAKWPPSHVRTSREKAAAELDATIAEMRAASNDARRLRSGEERLAAGELRRAAEDATERVRKVAEAAAQRAPSKEDRARAAVAAFHTLPLTAKLRAVADERAALALLAGSFLAGAGLVLAALAEVYSAWGCGFRCAAR